MPRRTKIVATLGPATDQPGVLDSIIQAGVDVVRLNFSHGKAEDHIRRAQAVRSRAAAQGRDVAVLVDLQGPKIRIERFRDGAVELVEGQRFVLDAALPADAGSQEEVGITYKDLPKDVRPGHVLLLDDGRLALEVEAVEGPRIVCRVQAGGPLSNNKGINLQGGGLSAPALTEKDRADILVAAELQADYLAVSFPRAAADLEEARTLLRAAGGQGGIVAKIERAEALADIDNIILASDAVMIARGDLAVEIGDAELVGWQKRLIRRTRQLNRVAITATQMMESMIHNQTPTRAEVMDVANAVLDGTDAVMLSAETASGKYPAKAVAAMARICLGAESQREIQRSSHRLDWHFERTDEAIAMAAMYVANHLDVRAIVCLTESGSTTLWMSRISSGIPIYALTRHEVTRRRVTLYRGVYPVAFDVVHANPNRVIQEALETLKARGAVADGDRVIVTKGEFEGIAGGTNTMKIVIVGGQRLPEASA
ncbi:MAG TPA: pyruvate kinase [Candidatus Competibacteraceae bacterium]|nr:pyruvate kinase [Candidatus Competibacteraceae bacterium]